MILKTIVLGTCASLALTTAAAADMVTQAVSSFQNGQATKGAAMTVDAKGPIEITDGVELPGFAFQVYDVDVTDSSVTMTLVADLEKLMITQYDATTFDRYYFAFDKPITSASLSDATDENFAASVELIAPGTEVSTAGAFVDGMPTGFTFPNGGILITVGEGTDLTKISANGGALTVTY